MHSQIIGHESVDSSAVPSTSAILNLLGGANARTEPAPDCSLFRREAGVGPSHADILHRIHRRSEPRSCYSPLKDSTYKTIGLQLNVPRQVVSRWRKQIFDLRLIGLQYRAPTRTTVHSPP